MAEGSAPPVNSDDDDDDDTGQQQGATRLSQALVDSAHQAIPLGKRAGNARGRGGSKRTKREATRSIPSHPPPKPPAPAPVLSSVASTEAAESYTEDEKALNSFLSMHPMLSLDATSQKALQIASDLSSTFPIPVQQLETISKSYDDAFLRPPNLGSGERECALGERCMCQWIAKFRYGENSQKGFVCREFLLPSEQKRFDATGDLPSANSKCLICVRYFHTYIYRLARNDSTFNPSASIGVQAFGNAIGHTRGKDLPVASSEIGSEDGYDPSCMLAVDAEFASTESSRSDLASFIFRPVVAFHSSHYEYTTAPDGSSRIVQVGVGAKQSDFGQPTMH